MSAGVSDQRMKGQGNTVSNGPKEQLGAGEGANSTEEFETWRSQQQNSAHTPYGASAPISSATDIYNMSYYGSGGTFPYQGFGVGDGAWSNGTDPMTFLSQYPPDSYSMEGMFGPSTTFSTGTPFAQPSSFNYFHSNGDFSTWGNQLSHPQRKFDEYYRDQQQQNMYTTQAMPGDSLKSVEQAMQSLDLKGGDSKDQHQQQKKTTWASIASQPAKPQLPVPNQGLKKKGPGMPPGPIIPGKHNMDIGTWETNKATPPQPPTFVNSTVPKSLGGPSMPVRPAWNGPPPTNRGPPTAPRPGPPPHPLQTYQPAMVPPHHMPAPSVAMPTGGPPLNAAGMMAPSSTGAGNQMGGPVMVHHQHQTQQQQQQQQQQQLMPTSAAAATAPTHPVLDELRVKNNYNPGDFDLSAPNARFFVIKSYSEDDIHRSIKYEIWCSTEHGNKRLDQAFRERDANGCVYLFFSVNGSGHFCGMAQMISAVDYNANSSVWSQDKWKGQFKVRWIYVKDVPNVQLKNIRLENNENKPVTNSRDTQEVPHPKGIQVLKIIHSYRHSTSIFDDFVHYEKRQEEEDTRKQPGPQDSISASSKNNNHHHQHQYHHGGHDGGGGGGGRDSRDPHHQQQHHHHQNSAPGGGRDHRDNRDHHHRGGGGGNHHRGNNHYDRGGGDPRDNDRQDGGARHGGHSRNYDGDNRTGDRDNRGGDRHHHHHERHHKDNGRGRGRNSRI